MAQWTFLTNHARVLLCIAHDPGVRLRDIADTVGITERSAYGIVSDLTDAGYVVKERDGRRNYYTVQRHLPLPEPTSRERTVGEVLNLLLGSGNGSRRAKRPARKRDGQARMAKATSPQPRGTLAIRYETRFDVHGAGDLGESRLDREERVNLRGAKPLLD